MVEFDRTLEREPASAAPIKICVAGVGSGGLNVLDRISLDRMMDATVVSMHTDVRVLSNSMSNHKIQLGADIMRGIGSGGDPELGREAAVSSREQIKAALQGHDMVFICCGLGGGTGSGAAPVVADIAKKLGSMVFVFATMPFSFEGRRRLNQAEAALTDLRRFADAVIIFENNRMGELVVPKEGIQKAFSQADQLIGHSVRAISAMVTQPGIVRMGLAELMSALRTPDARCLFGFGEGRGTNRGADALKRALKSPLVNQGLLLQNARNLLVHVAGGENLTLAEVENLMKQLGKHVPDRTQIMFGLAVDPRMGETIALTLISSLSAEEMATDAFAPVAQAQPEAPATEAELPELPQDLLDITPAAAPAPAPAAPVVVAQQAPAPAAVAPQAPVQAPAPAPAPVAEAAPPAQAASPVLTIKEDIASASAPAAVVHQASVTIDAAPLEPSDEPRPTLADVLNARAKAEAAERDLFAAEQAAQAAVAESAAAEAAVRKISAQQVKISIAPEITASAPTPAAPPVAAPAPAEVRAKATENQPVIVAKSIFSVVDDAADDDSAEDDDANWAQKYSQPQAKAPTQSTVAPKREPQPALAGSPAGFQQSTFNLHKEDSGRFKNTDKTIVEGEDMDIPTWMRLKQKGK